MAKKTEKKISKKDRKRNEKGMFVPTAAEQLETLKTLEQKGTAVPEAVVQSLTETAVVAVTTTEVKKVFTAEITEDHGMFGEFISDDPSFRNEATFVRSKANEQHVGVFVADGTDVIIGIVVADDIGMKIKNIFFTPKEAKALASVLLEAASVAKFNKNYNKNKTA